MLPYTYLNERRWNECDRLTNAEITPGIYRDAEFRCIEFRCQGEQQPVRNQLLSVIKFFRGCDAHAGRSIAVPLIEVSQERMDYWPAVSRIMLAVYRINLHEISVTIWGAADTWNRRVEYPHRRLCFPLRRSTSARNRNATITHWTIL